MNTSTLLIVEDDPALRINLDELLSPHFDAVSLCSRVASAYLILEKQRFDLALIDRVLPDGSGLELVSFLQDSSLQTKVILMSCLTTTNHRVQGLERGALDYLNKPLQAHELLLKLKNFQLLRRLPNDCAIRTASSQLDLATGELTISGQKYSLRKKEAALMSILMRDPDQIISRDTLIRNVWGQADPPQTTTIDVYLRRVRAKLGKHMSCIQTIRSYGYKFSEPKAN